MVIHSSNPQLTLKFLLAMHLYCPSHNALMTAATSSTILPWVLLLLKEKKNIKILPRKRRETWSKPVEILPEGALEEVLPQEGRIAQALEYAVHVAGVAQILQPRQAATLQVAEK